MNEKRNPTRWRPTNEAETPPRRLDCQHYSLCLDHAADLDWPGFSCSSCRAYEPEPHDPAWARIQAEQARALWEAAVMVWAEDILFEIVGNARLQELEELTRAAITCEGER